MRASVNVFIVITMKPFFTACTNTPKLTPLLRRLAVRVICLFCRSSLCFYIPLSASVQIFISRAASRFCEAGCCHGDDSPQMEAGSSAEFSLAPTQNLLTHIHDTHGTMKIWPLISAQEHKRTPDHGLIYSR